MSSTERIAPSPQPCIYIDRDLFLFFGTGGEASLDAEAGACVLAVERGRQDGETDKEPSMIFRSVGLEEGGKGGGGGGEGGAGGGEGEGEGEGGGEEEQEEEKRRAGWRRRKSIVPHVLKCPPLQPLLSFFLYLFKNSIFLQKRKNIGWYVNKWIS